MLRVASVGPPVSCTLPVNIPTLWCVQQSVIRLSSQCYYNACWNSKLDRAYGGWDPCALLRFYAAQIGSLLPTFRDNLSVPSSRVKQTVWPLNMKETWFSETLENINDTPTFRDNIFVPSSRVKQTVWPLKMKETRFSETLKNINDTPTFRDNLSVPS